MYSKQLTQRDIENLSHEEFTQFLASGDSEFFNRPDPADLDDSEFNDYLTSYKEFDL